VVYPVNETIPTYCIFGDAVGEPSCFQIEEREYWKKESERQYPFAPKRGTPGSEPNHTGEEAPTKCPDYQHRHLSESEANEFHAQKLYLAVK
jgi:hypothetical protein